MSEPKPELTSGYETMFVLPRDVRTDLTADEKRLFWANVESLIMHCTPETERLLKPKPKGATA